MTTADRVEKVEQYLYWLGEIVEHQAAVIAGIIALTMDLMQHVSGHQVLDNYELEKMRLMLLGSAQKIEEIEGKLDERRREERVMSESDEQLTTEETWAVRRIAELEEDRDQEAARAEAAEARVAELEAQLAGRWRRDVEAAPRGADLLVIVEDYGGASLYDICYRDERGEWSTSARVIAWQPLPEWLGEEE
jgi:hypothetical protein